MIVTTNKYSCDMYISTLFTSSVNLNRWWLNSITEHIQIYVGIAAIISLFRDISLTLANHIQQEQIGVRLDGRGSNRRTFSWTRIGSAYVHTYTQIHTHSYIYKLNIIS